MNWVDLAIIGVVGLVALSGLRSGLLAPVSGIGGLVLGIVLAVHYHPDAALLLAEYVEGEMVRKIAGFIIVVVATVAASRIIASLVQKLLSLLMLGWIDRLAGGVAGLAIGVVMVGTIVYLLGGADNADIQDRLAESSLAASISEASLFSGSSPWCSQIEQVAAKALPEDAAKQVLTHIKDEATSECTSIASLAGELFGDTVSAKLSDMIGQDVGTLAEVVGASLSGKTQELANLAAEEAGAKKP